MTGRFRRHFASEKSCKPSGNGCIIVNAVKDGCTARIGGLGHTLRATEMRAGINVAAVPLWRPAELREIDGVKAAVAEFCAGFEGFSLTGSENCVAFHGFYRSRKS